MPSESWGIPKSFEKGLENVYILESGDHNFDSNDTNRYAISSCFAITGWGWMFETNHLPWSLQGHSGPKIVEDGIVPSTVFMATAVGLYHLNKVDQYQDRFLLIGISCGAAVGLGYYRDLIDCIRFILPMAVIISLLASVVTHGFWRRCRWQSDVGPSHETQL
ncbi:hypothetical protein BS50DRAFT_579837, partial [Corynespora cassiicola Philippines]